MALYRETATGFVQEWATNPGAGYTAITSQPTDTIDHKVSWWRALDTFSQTSEWHPSLPGTPEYPGPDTRSGSGINIMPSDYASFEWAGSAPPTYTANATVARSTAYKYHGSYGLRYSISATGGIVGFASSASIYNITLNPNGKWIVSAYVRPVDNAVRTVSLQLTTTAGNTYTVTGNTLDNNASWVRITGVFNLSADASTTARMAISLSATGVQVDIDAVMLEEKVGPLSNPSTFNSPWGTGISTEQYPDYGIPQTKLYQDLGTRIDLIDAADYIPGSVNARLKTTSDALNTAIGANGSAIIALQSSDASQATSITAQGTRLGTAESSITTINQTTASQATTITQLQAKDSSHDSSITNLNTVTAGQTASISSLTTRTSNSESNITNLQTTTSNQATSISTLSSQVGTNTAAISTQSSVINGLSAQYMVKTDVNGYVAGFGLYNNGAGDSGFLVRADKFAIGFPGNSNRIPFYVDSTGTYIYDAFIRNLSADKINAGTLSADFIAAGSITAGKLNFTPLTAGSAAGDINAYATTIDGSKITTGSLNANRIVAGTITTSQLNFSPLTAGSAAGDINAYGTQIDGARIQTGTLYADRIVGGTITADKLVINGITTDRISGGAISNVVQDLRTYDQSFYNTGWTTVLQISFPAVAAGTRGPIQFMSTMEMRNWHALYWMAMSGDVINYNLKGYGQNAQEFAALVRIVRIGGQEINRVSTTMSFIHNSTSVAISGSDPNPGDAYVTYYVQAYASSWSDSNPDARIGSGSFVGMELKR